MRLKTFFILLVLVVSQSLPVQALSDSDINDIVKKHPFFAEEQLCDFNTGCSCSTATTTLIGSDNAEQIWNFFTQQGFQPHQAAGLMGNMKAESGLNPRRVQGTRTPEGDRENITVDGKTGYGLVQWTTLGRQQGLADLAKTAGVNSGDLSIQLDYIMKELQGGYRGSTYDPLLKTTTVEEATNVVLENYERPANIAQQRLSRQNFAREFLSQYGSGTGITTLAPHPVSGCAGAVSSGNCPDAPIDVNQTVEVNGIRVHSCIAQEVERIMNLAKSQGLALDGWGWRSVARQVELRQEHGCRGREYDPRCKGTPITALPGRSRHERGSAVDFTCKGLTIEGHSNPCFIFLRDNTSLINLPKEPWHWSIDGG